MMLPEASEEGSDVGDVVNGVGVEDYDVVEIRGDAFQVLMTSLVTVMNQPGEALLPCGITRHSNSQFEVQNAVKRMVHSSMAILWNKEIRSKSKNSRLLPKESRTKRGMGSCPRELTASSLLWLIAMRTPPSILFGDGDHRADLW